MFSWVELFYSDGWKLKYLMGSFEKSVIRQFYYSFFFQRIFIDIFFIVVFSISSTFLSYDNKALFCMVFNNSYFACHAHLAVFKGANSSSYCDT